MNSNEIEKRINPFLDGLSDLTRKTGLSISSCGCCDGIEIEECENKEGYSYRAVPDESGVQYRPITYAVNLSWRKDEESK